MILTKNGNLMKFASGAAVNAIIPPDPLNPLGLPPFTMRCKFSSGYTPTMGDSQTLVDAEENIWDIYKNSTDWRMLFSGNFSLIEILGFNSSNITNMNRLFNSCTHLISIPLFDTSSVTDMGYMCSSLLVSSLPLFDTSNVTIMECFCNWCQNLTTIPLYNTQKVTNINEAFRWCNKVTSGALALYQQMSSQANPPSNHRETFYKCGSSTTTGAAELAQIPSSWGGTAS